jgi:hypothetical protein
MANMQSEVFQAFRSIEIPEDKAIAAAGALAKRDDDAAALKSDTLVVTWLLGFVLAFQVAIIFKIFSR